jgi:hypothetical protein
MCLCCSLSEIFYFILGMARKSKYIGAEQFLQREHQRVHLKFIKIR